MERENGHQFVVIGFGTTIMEQLSFAESLTQHTLLEESLNNIETYHLQVTEWE